jgi:hypothetical protein
MATTTAPKISSRAEVPVELARESVCTGAPRHRERGRDPVGTMRLRTMSTIEASVLDEAIREILAIQRRMANKAEYVPDLQGSPLA